MSKGGFLSALLAERKSSSTSGFALRSLYYIYIGIPLLVVYYIIFHMLLSILVVPVMSLLGFVVSPIRERLEEAALKGDLQALVTILMAESWLVSFVKLGVVVAMYHFDVLDLVLQPVYYITKV
jgi:hypothetical protein